MFYLTTDVFPFNGRLATGILAANRQKKSMLKQESGDFWFV
ncbi:hypothetical protein GXM_02752 [Nostoc sphaeroides CCNUC1]|uniref:Uncharacterized protein n=1 Tax=Nostoc sphaeroides CCNUC1 TaxID=2653204 RepID=A0A5P8VXZ0_9NOSO|nr:hypothetical protein GXM_02752 [Nostoc sphaeroides CCNUC1]